MREANVSAVILAAGASRRMRGRDKLMEDAGDGVPLLRRVCDRAWQSEACEVVVVLGGRAEARADALDLFGPRTVINHDWQSGMASSIRAGIAALDARIDGALLVLGDMPAVDTALMDRLIGAFQVDSDVDIVRPRAASGAAGHPVLFGRRHFAALGALQGDNGARTVLRDNPDRILDLPTPDDSVLIDLDTPEDWAAWRRR